MKYIRNNIQAIFKPLLAVVLVLVYLLNPLHDPLMDGLHHISHELEHLRAHVLHEDHAPEAHAFNDHKTTAETHHHTILSVVDLWMEATTTPGDGPVAWWTIQQLDKHTVNIYSYGFVNRNSTTTAKFPENPDTVDPGFARPPYRPPIHFI